MGKLYQSTDPEKIYSSHVGSSTYGNPAIGKDDYHFTVYGAVSYTHLDVYKRQDQE